MRKLYEEYFYVSKYEKIRKKVFYTKIGVSVAVMCICMLVMSVTAYAYFSHSITSKNNRIQAAQFELTIESDTAEQVAEGTYTLNGGTASISDSDAAGSDTEGSEQSISDGDVVDSEKNEAGESISDSDAAASDTGGTDAAGNGANASDNSSGVQAASAEGEEPVSSKEFKFFMKNIGTATNGYCKIEVMVGDNTQTYYTDPIKDTVTEGGETLKGSFEVTIEVPAGMEAAVKFTPQWGSYSGGDDAGGNIIANAGKIVLETSSGQEDVSGQ